MMENLECPNCQNPITFLQFFKAPTPWHLKCQECNAKLKVGKYAGITFTLALVIGLIIGLTTDIYDIPMIYFFIILIFLAFGAEIVVYLLYRRFRISLVLRKIS